MIQLSNHCRVGKFSIFPKNWQAKNASTKIYWSITYRFHDDNLQKVKQIRIQGMNHLSNLIERQSATQAIIDNELINLKKGYNPILNYFISEKKDISIISGKTKFLDALKKAELSLNLIGDSKDEMRSIMRHIELGVENLNIENIPIKEIAIEEIKKRHIRALMNKMATEFNWSAYRWNKYRSNMMILFSELGEYDAVEYNIPREISKRKTVKKIRTILSEEERIKVRQYFLENNSEHNNRFWLFINMYFHSGARISEFYRLKVEDVDLDKQIMKVTIMKGRQYVEVFKPIKNVALPYWKEFLKGYENNKKYYIMGKGLFPAESAVNDKRRISRRWKIIKTKFNIKADFAALKHLNTDEISAQLSIEYAQKLNSHTNLATTRIYAVNQQARDMEAIKQIANEF